MIYYMIIYNVTIKVEEVIATAWVQWMKEIHIPELLATGLFSGYTLCKLLEVDETDGITYVAQYFCQDMDAYNAYIEKFADEMRARGKKRFGDSFVAFRTLMESI